MKALLIALTLISFNSLAQGYTSYGSYAGGSGYGATNTCGPTIQLQGAHQGGANLNSGGYGSYGSSQEGNSIQLGIQWNLDDSCHKRNEAQIAQAKEIARQARIDTLEQKIALCSRLDKATAPPSMKRYCGDLVGIQLKEVTPQMKNQQFNTPKW